MISWRYYNFYRLCHHLLMVVIIVEKDKCIRVSELSKMLVKRRLSIFSKTVEAYKVKWSMSLDYCQKYLTIVDCSPSQFAIWRNIQNESEGQVVSV